MKRGVKPSVFALYKGDEFIDVGTLREISTRQHLTVSTLRYLATNAYRRRLKDVENSKVLVRLDIKEDEG